MLSRKITGVIAGVLTGLMAAVSVMPFMSGKVLADGNIHPYNRSEVSASCLMTVIEGTYDPVSVDEILTRINGYRYEACAEGLKDPRDPERNLTLADYVPIKWSTGLEQMAMLRAAEASVVMDHVRPNAQSCFSAYYDVQSRNEVLAWGYGGILNSMSGWYSEKTDYVNETGNVTGHYTAMINPGNTYCGMSYFNGCGSGEFTSGSGYDETKIDVSQYAGQYTEISGSYITSVDLDVDSAYCQYNGGTVRFSGTFDIEVPDYWGRTRSVTGLKYVAGGSWSSSDGSVAAVSNDGTVTGGNPGTASITFTFGSHVITKTITVINGVPMFRLYNPNSGEHFYTSNSGERDHLISLGWNDEGIGWIAPTSSGTPVYRLYNQYGGEHHYTTSISERNHLISVGWNDEGIGWYSDDAQAVPLYRQYNPNAYANNHNYTTSRSENNWLVSIGWRAEGIGWYGTGAGR